MWGGGTNEDGRLLLDASEGWILEAARLSGQSLDLDIETRRTGNAHSGKGSEAADPDDEMLAVLSKWFICFDDGRSHALWVLVPEKALANIVTALVHHCRNNAALQARLAEHPDMPRALCAVMQCGHDDSAGQASLCLSQMALASPDTAVILTHVHGVLAAAEELIRSGSERTRDCAALLINNLAGMGGDESIILITKRVSLIGELVKMLKSHDTSARQLQRVTSTFNHLSRSKQSSNILRRFRVHEALTLVVTRRRMQEAGSEGIAGD